MEGHVLPVAAQVDGNRHLAQEREDVPLVPPCVSHLVFDGHGPPKIVPGIGVMVQAESGLHDPDRRFAVHGGELLVQSRGVEHASGRLDDPSSPELVVPRGHPDHGEKGVMKVELNRPWWYTPS